jgi:hypothetical protein
MPASLAGLNNANTFERTMNAPMRIRQPHRCRFRGKLRSQTKLSVRTCSGGNARMQSGWTLIYARRATIAGFRFFLCIEPFHTSESNFSTGCGDLNREIHRMMSCIILNAIFRDPPFQKVKWETGNPERETHHCVNPRSRSWNAV